MRLNLKIIGLCVALLMVLSVCSAAAADTPSDAGGALAQKGPQAFFPKTLYKFEPLFEGKDVTHDFVVENTGDAPLVIKKVKPG